MEVAIVVVDSRTAQRIKTVPAKVLSNNPANMWGATGDIQTFINGLPPNVQSGARIYSTQVILSNAK